MRILHIAPQNVAGAPWAFVQAERALGHTSRLITLSPDPRNFPEDVCLDLPFFDGRSVRLLKRFISDRRRLRVTARPALPETVPPVWQAGSRLEMFLLGLRDRVWDRRLRAFLTDFDLSTFDVIQLDGGLGFLRSGRYVQALKRAGKRIIVTYYGSDLRTRGILPHIDGLADVRATVEFDLVAYYPGIRFVPLPCDASQFARAAPVSGGPVRIGHAPSSRAAKGTAAILHAIDSVGMRLPVERVLIEGLPHAEALRRKAECHIFVDQVGSLGYGVNSLEACAMGIPVCTGLAAGFVERYPDHPFVAVTETTLAERLAALAQDAALRQERGLAGYEWVRTFHNPARCVALLHADLPEWDTDRAGSICRTGNTAPGMTHV